MQDIELTILMPCLNEAETLAICIQKAAGFLEKYGVAGEILIADNGSTDGSQEIARANGARVVDVPEKGYGAALIGGCQAAHGKYVIMGDADDSYDFEHLEPFLIQLRSGAGLVMGNRFQGGIEKGAMPPLHRYLGNPVLSFIGRLFYPGTKIGDFHCGLRGYDRQSILDLDLKTTGMEYASEMVVKAALRGLDIREVPTTLKKDGRSRPSHLRSFRDGWRHLKFLLMHSPDWLFLYPGMAAASLGAALMFVLLWGPVQAGSLQLDIHTMLYAAVLAISGVTAILFSILTRIYAETSGFIPPDKRTKLPDENHMILAGAIMACTGILITIAALAAWKSCGFGDLEPAVMMRLAIPAATAITCGFQFLLSGFLAGILKIPYKK